MCRTIIALETLQCDGKESVYKRVNHFLGVHRRGWAILSKLRSWSSGIVF